jgi:periplasmic copper chaperone A
LRAFLVMTAFLAGCQASPKEAIADAAVVLPAVAGRPGAAYFTLHGGPQPSHLISLSSPIVIRIELHESMMKGQVSVMKPLDMGVPVPAGGTVVFAPGGKHAMLFDINPKVKPGETIPLTFAYADGHTVAVDAIARAPGAAVEHHH